MEIESLSPPVQTPGHNRGPPRDIVGPICIAIEALMVLANTLPIFVVTKYKKQRDRITTDIIILALSITDMLSVLIPAPLGLPAYFLQRWYGGATTCQLYQLTSIWFQLASMCLVTYMCLDRWCILQRVINHRPSSYNMNKTRGIIAGIYFFTLFIAALPIMGLAPQAISNTGLSCRSWVILTSGNLKEHIFYIVFLVNGYANLLLAIIINVHVIYILISLKQEFGRSDADRRLNPMFASPDVDHRSIFELTTMALVVTLIFYMAWLPVLILVTLEKAGAHIGGIAVLYALLSTTLTGLLNPVLYAAFARSYRQGYLATFRAAWQQICCCLGYVTGLNQYGAKDRSQWQMVNTVSNTSSLLGLLSTDHREDKQCEQVAENTIQDITSSNQSEKPSEALVGFHKAQMHGDPSIQTEGNTENGDVMDSGVFERTYFDDALENDEDDDDNNDLDTQEFYGSKLSLISSGSDDNTIM